MDGMPGGAMPVELVDWAALALTLEQAGVRRAIDDVQGILTGIAAAPPPIGHAWLSLIDPALSDDAQSAAAQGLEDARILLVSAQDGTERPDFEARLAALRSQLKNQDLTGFVIPRGDEHQGEYVPAHAERLSWLTGFTGSAGVAVVLTEKAAIFIDGRYTLQVRHQVNIDLLEPMHLTETPPTKWVAAELTAGDRLGIDPWLHGAAELERWRAACTEANAELVMLDSNLIDAIWLDQPPPPIAPAVPHTLQFSGQSSENKRTLLADEMKRTGQQAVVLSAPDSIAWLLNLRGGDVPNTPFALSFAILHDDAHVELFMDPRKAAPSLAAHLGNAVSIAPPDQIGPALDKLAAAKASVRADPQTISGWISNRLAGSGAKLISGVDPCALPKASKNPVELDGIRAAHRRDGAALARFLAWLSVEAPGGDVDELGAIDRLAALRAEGGFFRGHSFDTISGAGPNGAIVHYRASPETNRPLEDGSLYLVDSGGQYLDGTTDVTRTVAIGAPTDEMRDRFTRVLKGHIALATVRFPVGTTGSQLDALARLPLWSAGLDYDHGTGHGVGSYLSVHEGPQRISKAPNSVALAPGMIISNEPGYYEEGQFGIRIENLVAVRQSAISREGGREMLEFETLTLAPIDRELIEIELLDEAERDWLNAYHSSVYSTVGPLVDATTRAWLREATATI